jgi:hypothetical protein
MIDSRQATYQNTQGGSAAKRFELPLGWQEAAPVGRSLSCQKKQGCCTFAMQRGGAATMMCDGHKKSQKVCATGALREHGT